MTTESKMSRRQFVGTAAAGAAALGAVAGATTLLPKVAATPDASGGLGASPAQVARAGTAARGGPIPVPTNWSQTADVVVVGYGGAGAISAITAYDAGANVLILEKTPSYAALGVTSTAPYIISGGGGDTCMNAGGSNYVTDPIAATKYIYQTAWGNTPMDVCEAMAWMETDTPAWLTKMGVAYTTSAATPTFPSLGGSNAYASISLTGKGAAWFQTLDNQVQKRKIPILFATPATDLIQDPTTGEILGVKALANNSEVLNIKADRGVILTTGSFEFNETMKSDNLRCYPAHGYGWQFNTGDSVTMASKVGAAMWHMGVMSMRMVPWFPQYPVAFGSTAPSQHGWIYVDKNGNRYADETELSTYSTTWWIKLSDFDLTVPWYTRIPSFIIFDSTCCNAGAISSGSSGLLPTYLDPRPKWSANNQVEIGNGWIQQGATIQALVAAMNSTTYVGVPPGTGNSGPAATATININPNTLTATLNNYNSYCASGVDAQFGRPKSTLVPIVTPPFYSMPLWPGGPSLYGGPVRNAMAQICDEDRNAIPRLYSAGENGDAGFGLLDALTNNGQMVAWGRIAGNNAAAENPWTS